VSRRLEPDALLAIGAVVGLAGLAAALGGELGVPWDGVLPFAAVGGMLLASSSLVDGGLALAGRLPARRIGARQLRALRLWAPFAIVYLCYRALRGALPVLVSSGFEDQLRALDEALLGASPAWWLERIHAPWLTELLAYAYATMFFLPLAVLLVLHARGRDRELRRVALALQLAFYLGFAIFLVVPARSPDVVYRFPSELSGYGFYEASTAAWRRLQAVTFDAFPSMHTAISTIALIYAWRLRRVLAPARPWLPVAAMVPVVALLQLATLYLRQHYFVDLIAGWAVAGIATAIAARWLGGATALHAVP
jgi:membrane-associated phospholipid phosphatase